MEGIRKLFEKLKFSSGFFGVIESIIEMKKSILGWVDSLGEEGEKTPLWSFLPRSTIVKTRVSVGRKEKG